MKTVINGKTYYYLSCYYHKTSKNTGDWIDLYEDEKCRLFAYVRHVVGEDWEWDGTEPYVRRANSRERKDIKKIGRTYFPRWSWRRVLMEMKQAT